MSRESFKHYIPSKKEIPELTLKALLVGAFLSIVMGAANAYLGLFVGMTVSATIPAAVMSVALLKPLKANLLEVNIAKVATSAGESLAAGVIFTVPALVVLARPLGLGGFGVDTGWSTIHLVETALIALVGGVLGVLFTVTLRKTLIVETELPFPEGIAATAVLTTIVGEDGEGSDGSDGAGKLMILGAVIAAVLKFCQSSLTILAEKIEVAVSVGKYKIMGEAGHEGYFYGGSNLSPALLGVGYIVGPKIASYVIVGGLLGWVILIPIIILIGGMPAGISSPVEGFYEIWSNQVRYIGVGAMIVGGLWTLFTLRSSLFDGIKKAVLGARAGAGKEKKRTQVDLNFKKTFLAIGLMVVPMFIVYAFITEMWAISAFFAVVMLVVAFLASAIAGYMAGLVGSSNNPISGVTVAVLLFTALMALGLGLTGTSAYIVVIAVAAVACCAAAISGDVMQDLATGYMIGATPWRMQISEIVGVVAVSPFIGIVVYVLDQAWGLGSEKLLAPQAFMMAGVVHGVLGGEMIWPYILAGVVLAFILILIDLPVLPVAIGVYLPFTLGAPIFAGGAVRWLVNRHVDRKVPPEEEDKETSDWESVVKKKGLSIRDRITQKGLIMSAGLIAGEALTGVAVAGLIVAGLNLGMGIEAGWPSLLIWLFIAALIGYIVLRDLIAKEE
ncbi:MAG: oligopeptide transporter, OPT family [Candidatus Thermoplasmatota archaeon]